VSDRRDRNKANAIAFYELMFNENRPREAVERYVGERYTQHNPFGEDGPEAFIAYFEEMAEKFPGKRVEIVRAVAEGSLVVLHCHQVWPNGEEYAGMDIFGFNDAGRIVEHWDVLQPVPPGDRFENSNGMF
jgi:predicted SnoaL-like aldol condensation-catalyzing enzyme